jgi:predicted phosphohydrolase
MVTFQILSDLHSELLMETLPLLLPKAEYLFLAGDITNINYKLKSCKIFFKYCNDNWTKTIYIPGNHEYYSASNTIHEMKIKYKNFFEENNLNNIVFLDNDIYEIQKDIFIIGSTFWTKSPFSIDISQKNLLNDYNYIFWEKKQKILPHNINNLSKTDHDFIIKQINNLKNKQIIVITHFPPYTTHPKFLNESFAMKQYFSWPNDILINFNKFNNIKYWISGHTHYSYDFTINNIRLISKQYGYKNESIVNEPNYNSELVCMI